MDILQEVQNFINSKDFWLYHGFVLSGLWVLLSALAIMLKKINTQLHVLLFILIDATTIFFAGAALWRVSSSFSQFNEWPLLKKAHVSAGTYILLLRCSLFIACYRPTYRWNDCLLGKKTQCPAQKLWKNSGYHWPMHCRSGMDFGRQSKKCYHRCCCHNNLTRTLDGS